MTDTLSFCTSCEGSSLRNVNSVSVFGICRAATESSPRQAHADVLQLADEEIPTLLFSIPPQDDLRDLPSSDAWEGPSERSAASKHDRAKTAVHPSSSRTAPAPKPWRPKTASVHTGSGLLRGSRSRPTTAGGIGVYTNRRKYEATFGHL